uniref:Uncharacterized protein n=1 Tax=Glossina palpalis gambiensis TaxID=67801 RepID=A0A1B0AQ64_9MUSC
MVTYLYSEKSDHMLAHYVVGFEPQIRKVLLCTRPYRQTIITSSTWPPGLRHLAKGHPIPVYVESLQMVASLSIRPALEAVDERENFYVISPSYRLNL